MKLHEAKILAWMLSRAIKNLEEVETKVLAEASFFKDKKRKLTNLLDEFCGNIYG